MLLGVVLLYVGVVLAVNGIWLVGQARAAQAQAAAVARRGRVPTAASGTGRPAADEAAEEAAAGEELAGVPVVSVPRAEASPMFIQNREVAVINIFSGFVAVVGALTFLVQGNAAGNLASVRAAGYVLLFAFTYLWVSINQFLNAGGRAFGWYCLFVAITAIPAGIFTLQAAHGNTAQIWLGINWFAWAVLWGMFWALLALELPIARITGWLAVLEGIGTGWALAIAVLEGALVF
jgi:putative amide transporter protein